MEQESGHTRAYTDARSVAPGGDGTMRDEHQTTIGALIARLREQQGWSQRALAKWVGIDQSAVSRIEAGHRRLSADELQRFADVLHVSADDLLRGLPAAPYPPGPAPARDADERAASGANARLLSLRRPCRVRRARRCRPASGDELGRRRRSRAGPRETRGVRQRPSLRRACVCLSAPEDWRAFGSPSPHPDLGALDADQAEPSLSHSLRIDAAGAVRTSPLRRAARRGGRRRS